MSWRLFNWLLSVPPAFQTVCIHLYYRPTFDLRLKQNLSPIIDVGFWIHKEERAVCGTYGHDWIRISNNRYGLTRFNTYSVYSCGGVSWITSSMSQMSWYGFAWISCKSPVSLAFDQLHDDHRREVDQWKGTVGTNWSWYWSTSKYRHCRVSKQYSAFLGCKLVWMSSHGWVCNLTWHCHRDRISNLDLDV